MLLYTFDMLLTNL